MPNRHKPYGARLGVVAAWSLAFTAAFAVACAALAFGTTVALAAPLRDAAGKCVWFPPSNPLRRDISALPVHANSAAIIQSIAPLTTGLHADFGDRSGEYDGVASHYVTYGIPMMDEVDTANGWSFNQIQFDYYADESDPGPYPFPRNATIEGSWPGCSMSRSPCNGDRHVLVADQATCTLYEAWRCAEPVVDRPWPPWRCANGAKFDLSSAAMPQRPLGWTSGDAAGLPIAPLLIRVDEVKAGAITTAIRFTAPHSRQAYERPAAHFAPRNPQANSPWMGMRARLKASFNCDGLTTPAARVICRAMKKTGLILADNGAAWYVQGEATSAWWTDPALGPKDDFQADIRSIKASDMEVVATGECLCTNSGCTTCVDGGGGSGGGSGGDGGGGGGDGGGSGSGAATVLVLRAGLAVTDGEGNELAASYDGNAEAGISRGNGNGATVFWPSHTLLTLAEPPEGGGTPTSAQRALLRFGGLEGFVPARRYRVASVTLGLAFVNDRAEGAADARAQLLTRPWVAAERAGVAASAQLGWLYRGPPLRSGGRPPKWKVAGAFNARAPAFTVDFTIPAGGGGALVGVNVTLPLAQARRWAAGAGGKNHGVVVLLQDGAAGAVQLVTSPNADAAARPTLFVEYGRR